MSANSDFMLLNLNHKNKILLNLVKAKDIINLNEKISHITSELCFFETESNNSLAQAQFAIPTNYLHFFNSKNCELSNPDSAPFNKEKLFSRSLIFVSSLNDLQLALEFKISIIITTKILLTQLTKTNFSLNSTPSSIISCNSIQLAMAHILPLFENYSSTRKFYDNTKASIHPTAQIDPTCVIYPNVTIEENVVIKANSIIQSGTFIGAGSEIDSDCFIYPNVFIGYNTIIGSKTIIHSGVRIGTDGYGYAPSKLGPLKIPQLGNVIIGSQVEIGGNTCIDRGTISSTIIGSKSKLDNLVHIAHNCVVGSNCLITAGFMMAGSSQIGDNFMCGGGVVVSDHVTICSNVTLGGRSTVTKDIDQPGSYAGYPLMPLKDSLKVLSTLSNIVELRKDVAQIKKQFIDKPT